MTRLPATTLRVLGVTLVVGGVLAVSGGQAAWAGDPPDAGALLRAAERSSATPAQRLDAARQLVDAAAVPDVERTLRLAAVLLRDDVAVAGALARKALDDGFARPELRTLLAAEAARALATATDPALRQALSAVLVLAGVRDRAVALFEATPPTALALAVVRRDAPELTVGDALPSADAWAAHARLAALLDAATEDDPQVAMPALDALVAAKTEALPLLLATAAAPRPSAGPDASPPRASALWPNGPAPTPTPLGLVPRRVRAIVALGAARDARAVPVLMANLDDREHGSVRLAAIDALGDLGDPRALPVLARVLFYQGDRSRPHDGWEYPGAANVDVPPEQWGDVAYWALDSAACNALLRLGVRSAAEWLIEERLDPRTGRWRIRVPQDGIEAIRRAFPDAPDVYEPDAGYPARQAGVDALRAWWRAGRRLAHPLDEADPAVRVPLDAMAMDVGGPGIGVMNLMIAKRAASLMGPAITPSLLRVLATSTRRVQRAELALVLGAVRDRRAVAPLVELTRTDPVAAVRANAAEALAAYADPERPGLVDGTSPLGAEAIVARWLEMLADPEPGPRASAVKALTSIAPSPAIAARLDAEGPAKRPDNDFEDYRLADEVAHLVHGGASLDAVVARLDDPVLYRRRFVWELLRAALRLDPRAFDPGADPGAATRRAADRALLTAALARRRGA